MNKEEKEFIKTLTNREKDDIKNDYELDIEELYKLDRFCDLDSLIPQPSIDQDKQIRVDFFTNKDFHDKFLNLTFQEEEEEDLHLKKLIKAYRVATVPQNFETNTANNRLVGVIYFINQKEVKTYNYEKDITFIGLGIFDLMHSMKQIRIKAFQMVKQFLYKGFSSFLYTFKRLFIEVIKEKYEYISCILNSDVEEYWTRKIGFLYVKNKIQENLYYINSKTILDMKYEKKDLAFKNIDLYVFKGNCKCYFCGKKLF